MTAFPSCRQTQMRKGTISSTIYVSAPYPHVSKKRNRARNLKAASRSHFPLGVRHPRSFSFLSVSLLFLLCLSSFMFSRDTKKNLHCWVSFFDMMDLFWYINLFLCYLIKRAIQNLHLFLVLVRFVGASCLVPTLLPYKCNSSDQNNEMIFRLSRVKCFPFSNSCFNDPKPGASRQLDFWPTLLATHSCAEPEPLSDLSVDHLSDPLSRSTAKENKLSSIGWVWIVYTVCLCMWKLRNSGPLFAREKNAGS